MDDELPLDDPQAALEACGRKHSARFLRERNPRLFETITLLLEYGVSGVEIADRAGVSRNVVAAIDRERVSQSGDSVEHHKKRLLAGFRRLSEAAVNKAQELLDSGAEVSLKDLAILAGVATEKEQLLEGSPTQRVEYQETPGMAALRRALAGPMVLEGGNIGPNGGAVARISKVPAGPILDAVEVSGEMESPNNAVASLHNNGNSSCPSEKLHNQPHETDADQPPDDSDFRGGGGGADAEVGSS